MLASFYAVLVATACNKSPTKIAVADTARSTALAETRDSVKALLHEFTERMNAGDLEGVGKLYSNDSSFSWIENGSLTYRNVKDVRDALLTLKSVPGIKLVYYETHIDVLAPGIATVRTEFSQTFGDKTRTATTYGGYLTTTVVREKDGYRLRNGHTSSRKPRP